MVKISSDLTHMGIFLGASVVWLYLICYFGDEVASHFRSISDSMYQSDWYLFSLEMKKSMIMVLAAAQKPVYICKFGQIHCTREIFKSVCLR